MIHSSRGSQIHPVKVFVGSRGMDMPKILSAVGLAFSTSDWDRRDVEDTTTPRFPDLKPGPWYEKYVVAVRSVAELREILPLLSSEGSTSALYVFVSRSRPEFECWSQAAGEVGYSWRRVTCEEGAGAGVLVSWTSRNRASVHGLLVKIATPRQSHSALPLGGLRLGVASRQGAHWAAGDPLARWVGDTRSLPSSEPVDSVDVGISADGTITANNHIAQGWTDGITMAAILPPVDTALMSPSGFVTSPTAGIAHLMAMSSTGSWTLTSPQGGMISRFDDLDENVLALLRPFSSVVMDYWNTTATGFRVARLISQLAVAGVPISLKRMDPDIAELLGPELVSMLRTHENVHFQSDLERESVSIDCRREALRGFTPSRRWANMMSTPFLTDESVSIVLPTRRPELLPRILSQIERQSATELEVLIGLHGHTLSDPDMVRLFKGFRFEVKVIPFLRECSLGSVLNGLTREAGGRFVTKMDDDDWYAPHHIEDLLLGKAYSGAGLVGTPVEFTYLEAADITTQRKFAGECFTDHVAGGTLLLSKELIQGVGGWRATRAAVDRGLIDAVRATGERVYRIHGQNYLMHRRSPVPGVMAHTWSAGDEVFLRNSINQWDGFSPPPQFGKSADYFTPPGRWSGYDSFFNGTSAYFAE